MTYRLALAIASDRVGAAVIDGGNVSWFDLGDDGEGVLSAVHLAEDGTVTVGVEALAAAGGPGRFDPDPVGSLGTDELATDSVAALLGAVVGEVTAAQGESPELVMLAHPDDWPVARTRALTDAARRAELGSFERASAGAAADAYRKVSGDDGPAARGVGYGAAVLAAGAVALDATQATPSAGPAPIITLEDIAGPLPDATPPEPPTYQTEGSSSVFDDSAPAASSPPTQALPVIPPPPPPGPPSEPPPPDDDGGNGWARWAVILGVAAAVLLLALILVLVNDDGGGDQVATDGSTTTVAGSTSSIAASSSTTASTSTTSTSTTTSTTTTSTTTTSTTTSTTTTSTTTTTVPEPIEVLVEPLELVVDPAGVANSIAIGSDGTVAVATLVLALGDADDDVVLSPENCATPQVRRVRWAGLEVVLLDDETQTFGQWVVDGRFDGADDFRTAAGVGVGTSVDELFAAYDDVELDPAGGGLEEHIFVVDEPGGTIVGITSGGDGDDEIESFWSGDGCNNLFAL